MKKTILITLVICTSGLVKAQWLPSGATSGPVYYNGGNVGIGTPSPQGALHISKIGSNAWAYFGNNLNGPNKPLTNYGLSLGWNYSGANGESIINYNTATGSRPRLSFTSFNGTMFKEEVVIEKGNLGIGTTAPASQLDVSINLPAQGTYETQKWSTSDPNYNLRLQTEWGGWGINQKLIQKYAGTDYISLAFYRGNVGIGTSSPDATLAVKGTIHTNEVKVDLLGAVAPDYVFDSKYKLPSLAEIQQYINQNKHLPEVPSAKEMDENGINLKEMNLLLLKKVEELTLYIVEQNGKLENQRKEILKIREALNSLKSNTTEK